MRVAEMRDVALGSVDEFKRSGMLGISSSPEDAAVGIAANVTDEWIEARTKAEVLRAAMRLAYTIGWGHGRRKR